MADLDSRTTGLCECGCGGHTPLARQGNTKRGYVKGQPVRFIQRHWRPERTTTGYPMRSCIGHPRASASGCVGEHVLIAEAALGRYLPDGVDVHHVDENITNNANSNLVICQDRAYHKLLHLRARVVRAGRDPDTQRLCGACHTPKPFSAFYRLRDGLQRRCRDCSRTYGKSYVRPREHAEQDVA